MRPLPLHLFIGDVQPDVHSTLAIGGAQLDVRPWQCIPLPFSSDCAHTVFVSSVFTLYVTDVVSQPNIVSHYGQVYNSQKVCVSRPILLDSFFCFDGYISPLKIFHTFLTFCIKIQNKKLKARYN